jgi:hypothetical protein
VQLFEKSLFLVMISVFVAFGWQIIHVGPKIASKFTWFWHSDLMDKANYNLSTSAIELCWTIWMLFDSSGQRAPDKT